MKMRTNHSHELENGSRNDFTIPREPGREVDSDSDDVQWKSHPLRKTAQLLEEFIVSKPGTAIAVGLVIGGILGWTLKRGK